MHETASACLNGKPETQHPLNRSGDTHEREPMMRTILGPVAVVLTLGASLPLSAHASLELAREKNCMACHAVDKKMVGPSYQDVAKKYAGQKGAQDMLAQKIVKGSQGVWGTVPMPPNAHVTNAEAQTLAQWILGLQK